MKLKTKKIIAREGLIFLAILALVLINAVLGEYTKSIYLNKQVDSVGSIHSEKVKMSNSFKLYSSSKGHMVYNDEADTGFDPEEYIRNNKHLKYTPTIDEHEYVDNFMGVYVLYLIIRFIAWSKNILKKKGE